MLRHCRIVVLLQPSKNCIPQNVTARAQTLKITRRGTLILTVLPWDAILGAFQGELGLWKQEIDFYGRKARQSLEAILPGDFHEQPKLHLVPMNAVFAGLLLEYPLTALATHNNIQRLQAWDPERYQKDFTFLSQRELKAFQQTNACGMCGKLSSTENLQDTAYWDFLSYIQYKSVARQLLPVAKEGIPPLSTETEWDVEPSNVNRIPAEELSRSVGRLLLQHAQSQVTGDARNALMSTSAELDDIRLGVRVILDFFLSQGYMQDYQLIFFGASRYEERNHLVWARGEPAFLKYWMRAPATRRSSIALSQEESGFTQGFLMGTIAAYLEQSGVATGQVNVLPDLLDEGLLAEQATLRRVRDLPPARTGALAGNSFRMDLCPNKTDTGCY